VYFEVYFFWKKRIWEYLIPSVTRSPGNLQGNIECQDFWKDAEDMYSRRFHRKGPMLIQEDRKILDQFLMHEAFRISGPKLAPESGGKLATLAKGGLVVVSAATLPGDMVYFQLLGNDMHFTVLRPFSPLAVFTGEKLTRMIRHELRFRNERIDIRNYALMGAGSVGVNNDIKKLISHLLEIEGEHIIALLYRDSSPGIGVESKLRCLGKAGTLSLIEKSNYKLLNSDGSKSRNQYFR
jgi:hypothetical protein